METEYHKIEKRVAELYNRLRETSVRETMEDILELVELEIALSKWEVK